MAATVASTSGAPSSAPTAAPSEANSRALARPIPLAAPVTRATLPCSVFMFLFKGLDQSDGIDGTAETAVDTQRRDHQHELITFISSQIIQVQQFQQVAALVADEFLMHRQRGCRGKYFH